MQEVLGELLHHTPPMRAMPCQELVCLLGVLEYLKVPFTKVPSENAGKLQNTTVPRKSKEGCKLT